MAKRKHGGKHGGKRPGAGRPAKPEERKIPLAIKIDRELFAYLGTLPNKTAEIETRLRSSKRFREWKQAQ